MTTRHKAITGVRVKDADQGTVEAVFATFDVVDKDGDYTKAEAIADGTPVAISAWQHGSWKGELPVGTGVVRNDGKIAKLEGQFLMDTPHGLAAFKTVQALSAAGLQEWSYSLHNVKAHREKIDGVTVNVLTSIHIKEVSPVMIGAGDDTRTIAIKSEGGLLLESAEDYVARRKRWASDMRDALRAAVQERWGSDDAWTWVRDYDPDDGVLVAEIESMDEYRLVQVEFDVDDEGGITLGDTETDVRSVTTYAPKGATFAEHCAVVVSTVQGLADRAADVVTMRTKAGRRPFAADRRSDLETVAASLANVLDRTKATTPEPAPSADVLTEDELRAANEAFASKAFQYRLTQGASR